MYSEYHRDTPTHRANDAFLRRMLGGDLKGAELYRLQTERHEHPTEARERRVDCRGNVVQEEAACGIKSARESSDGGECDRCPTEIPAPALAMVYAPRQCWRGLFDPQTGLAHGSLFAELILPFEGCPKYGRTEGKPCK
ncbi:MAG: spore coat associated protein CotJA [Clostridia bacterium]|nr:spore coat associated protein CotJA [Clostridia bacterium]